MKNSKPIFRVTSLILVMFLFFTSVCPVAAVAAAETGWSMCDDTHIYLVETDDSNDLSDQMKLFASNLAEKVTGKALPIVCGKLAQAGDNDIILILDSSLSIASQGYEIVTSGTSVIISASDADGLYYGCNDLIKQLLVYGYVVSKSEAPDVLERTISLDNGRKYYSVEWIKELIREMSWSNMNALVLHFSEEMGMGIESKLYPWLNGRDGTLCTQAEIKDDDRYLTQDEVAEIVAYAKQYHVEIIPSLDSPGHMNYIVKLFNEQCAEKDFSFTYDGKTYIAKVGSEICNYFHYNGQTSIVKGSRNANYSRGIDISNEVAVAFTRSLIEEYATLFAELGCTKFDIGGDELLGWGSAVVSTSIASRWQQLDHWKSYAQERAHAEGLVNWKDAVAYDAFLYYMNDLYDLVTELGYTSVRMWNDDALRSYDTGWKGVVNLNTNIDIWFWSTGNNTFWTYAGAGYQLYNILSDYNYYAMTNDYYSENRGSFAQAYVDQIYNEWNPYVFDPTNSNPGGKNPALTNPNVLGGAFGIWSDNPELKTEVEVMTDVLPLIRANAAKSWDATVNRTIEYDAYVDNWKKIGSAPSDELIIPAGDPTALAEAVAASESTNGLYYEFESYMNYIDAVNYGKVLLESDDVLQTELDVALNAINDAYAALVPVVVNEDVSCYISGSFKSTYVRVGKVATLNISTEKGVDINGFEVYDDQGDRIEFQRCTTTSKTDRNITSMIFQVSEEDLGQRNYTVYAVLEDGSRTADAMEFTIEVR